MHQNVMKVLRFDENDLEKNRKGVLSHKQKQTVMKSARALLIVLFVLGVIFAGLIYLVMDKPLKDGQYAAMGILVLLFTALGLFFYFRSQKGISTGRVIRVTGKISFTMGENTRCIQVQGVAKKFPIAALYEEYFDSNRLYHVYYVDSIMNIVAIEEATS